MSAWMWMVLIPEALAGPSWSWFSASDLDDDGIPDRKVACVRIPEIENGYQDEDGCPDVLSGFTLGASFATMIEERATLVATANGETRTGRNQLAWTDLVPGTEVRVVAGLGCHAAETAFVVEEKHRRVRVKLEPALYAPVTFVVRDPFGEAPDRAVLEWVSTDPGGCGPSEEVVLERGYGVVQLGRGTHTVKVRTPGGARTQMELVVGKEPQDVLVDMPLKGRVADGGRLLPDTVYFSDNSDVLDDEATAVVQKVASYLREHAELSRVLVEGHADERAWAPYNEELSERRARAVVAALVEAGVSDDRLRIEGRGEKDPADEGHTAEAYALNRRVHFIVGK